MAMGVYCDNCKHKELEHKFATWPCMDCCDGDRCESITNSDRIRAMSDAELAEWRASGQCPTGRYNGDYECVTQTCAQCWLDWLRQEVTE